MIDCTWRPERSCQGWFPVSTMCASRGPWHHHQAGGHQKEIGLVGEMVGSVLLGLGSIWTCVALGKKIMPGGREMGVVFIQVVQRKKDGQSEAPFHTCKLTSTWRNLTPLPLWNKCQIRMLRLLLLIVCTIVQPTYRSRHCHVRKAVPLLE